MQVPALLFGAALACLVTSGGALAASVAGGVIQSVPYNGHHVLTDTQGRTLYTYDNDNGGVPTCSGLCAAAWPWMKAAPGAVASGALSPVAARGGTIWAYNGHPLYRYAGDHKAGDVTGDGAEGVWHAAVVR